MESELMQIIVFAGNARSQAMKSITSARKGDAEAQALLVAAEEDLKQAHQLHGKIISISAQEGQDFSLSLFMVHAEDHLMSAITTIDLAKELCKMYDSFGQLKAELATVKRAEISKHS